MSKKKKQQKKKNYKLRRAKATFGTIVIYSILCIIYIHLPQNFRNPIRKNLNGIDSQFTKSGNKICDFFEDLGIWGYDQSVKIDKPRGEEQVYGGFPKQGLANFNRAIILENTGFTVGYSESLKSPLCSAYRVFDVKNLDSGDRPASFYIDKRTAAKVSQDDYTRSGFDRGHLAPNFAIATRYGNEAQNETFLMSNIIPQTPNVNQRIWKDLEMLVAKKYGRYFDEVWVITGPIFNSRNPERLESGVAIPDAYYKIIVDESDGNLRALAFIIDRFCPPNTRIKSHLVSIDEIEQKTALDFFSDLPNDKEAELEATPAKRLWATIAPSFKYRFGEK